MLDIKDALVCGLDQWGFGIELSERERERKCVCRIGQMFENVLTNKVEYVENI